MTLTAEQSDRYSRLLALHDFSEVDMEAVMNTTVTVVGAGGLGSPALRLLTAMGFGTIRIIDRDVVELVNFQRQTIYHMSDIDKPKAEAAAANLALMNPEVKFEPIGASLDSSNAIQLLKGSDMIVDGLDSFHTRHSVNKASLKLNIPYIFAGAIAYNSNLTTFIPGETGCLYCLAGKARDDPEATCATIGVSPELLSIAAAVEVREALLLAIGREPILKGRVMTIDMSYLEFDFFDVEPIEDCPVCSVPVFEIYEKTEGPSVTVLCSGDYCIAPSTIIVVDIDKVTERLKDSHRITRFGQSLLIKTPEGARVTLMAKGMAIVKEVSSQEDALQIYHDILGE
jgi:adenylyltransferase/sulfurtransferase